MLKPKVCIFRCSCSWRLCSCSILVSRGGIAFPLVSGIWLLAESIISLLDSLNSTCAAVLWWKRWCAFGTFLISTVGVLAGSIFLRQPQVLIDTVNLLRTAEPDWEAIVFSADGAGFSEVAAWWVFSIVAKSSVLWVVIASVVGSGLVVVTGIGPGFSEAQFVSYNFWTEGIWAFDAVVGFPLPETIGNWD